MLYGDHSDKLRVREHGGGLALVVDLLWPCW